MKTSITVTAAILKSFPYLVMRSDGGSISQVKATAEKKKNLSQEKKREFLNNRNMCD